MGLGSVNNWVIGGPGVKWLGKKKHFLAGEIDDLNVSVDKK